MVIQGMFLLGVTLLVVIGLANVVKSQSTNNEFFKDIVCDATKTTTCASHPNSICDTVNDTVKRCACLVGMRVDMATNRCIKDAALGQICLEGVTLCKTPKSLCKDDGTDSAINRCTCQDGYHRYNDTTDSNTIKCVQKLAKLPECSTCEANKGTCVSKWNNDTKTDCLCPVYRIGPECATILVKNAALGEICLGGVSTCAKTANSLCKDDGTNSAMNRCTCQDRYHRYNDTTDSNTIKCVQILPKLPECSTCEANNGTCVSKWNNDTKSDCMCPVYRTGPECATILVNVTCVTSSFEMVICYSPHPGVNFTTGAQLYVDGRGTDEACKGKLLVNKNTHCLAGQVQLTLPLTDGLIDRCGTKEIKSQINALRYENKIVVQKVPGTVGSEDIVFRAYCSYKTQSNVAFQGVVGNAVPGHDSGDHKTPTIKFDTLDSTGRVIPDGVSLQLGDYIKFNVTLLKDGTYSAIRMERCTASSSAVIPDIKASTAPLIIASCPIAGQSIFNVNNNFRLLANQSNVLITGDVKTWKMRIGTTVFLHCTARLCLLDKETDCAPIDCTKATSDRRKKRQAESDTVDITKEIIISENSSQDGFVRLNLVDFALLMTVMVVLLVVFIALSVVLFLRYRSNAPQVEAFGEPNKPQRFAVPRIKTPSMRI